VSPAVSVLITVHDGEAHLREAIDSVLAQTLGDLELVVVDDGSTDATPQVLASIADPRLKVITRRHEGRGPALRVGLAACRAPYVAILDGDDLAYPARLEVQREAMQRRPEIAALGARCDMREPRADAPVDPALLEPRLVVPRMLARGVPAAHSTMMLRRSALDAVGGYDASRTTLLDYDLWLRLAERGAVLARIDVPLGYHRLHPGQRFESRRRLVYVVATFRMRLRAVRRFGHPVDAVIATAGLLFGLLPRRLRLRLFRLAGE
jgi:glycosyltransferase involved in cell wall biosynthesis